MRMLLALATLVALASPALAEGQIWFTDELVESTLVEGCASHVPTYAATMEPPAQDAEPGKIHPAFAAGGLACPSTVAFNATEDFSLKGDGTGTLFFGCEAAAAAQDVWLTLYHNGQEVSTDDQTALAEAPIVCDGPGSVTELTFTLGADIDVVAGDTLRWEITMFQVEPNQPFNPEAHQGNAHIKAYSHAFPSGFQAVGLPFDTPDEEGPFVVHEDLDEGAFTHDFSSPQNGTFRFNWSSDLASAHLQAVTEDASGEARLTIIDGDGTTLIEQDVVSRALDEVFKDVAPGPWQIIVAYHGFTGRLDVAIDEPPSEDDPEAPTTTAPPDEEVEEPDASPTPVTTTSPPVAETDDSPAVWLPLVLVGIAVLVLRRRH